MLMHKNLIVEKFHKYTYLKTNNYKNIYSFKPLQNKNKTKIDLNNQIKLSKSIITARLSIRSRHKTSVEGANIYNYIVKRKDHIPFIKIGGKIYSESVFKKLIYGEVEIIFTSLLFAEKVIKKYEINEKVDLVPTTISFTIFQIMKRLELIPENIRIPWNILLYMRIRESFRNIYYLIRFVFYPESLLLRMRGKGSNQIKKKYKIGGHLYHGIGFKTKPFSFDFFITDKDKWKDKIIYVIDEPAPAKYVEEVKQSGYKVVDFNTDLIRHSNRTLFFKSHYLNTITLRIQLFRLVFDRLFYARTIYFAYRSELLWRIFNDRYEVGVLFHMMHPGDLASVAINQRYGIECVFFYCSTTHNRIDRNNNYDSAEEVYYSNMIFDKILSNKASNKWFRSNQNHIKNYIDIGSIMSDFVFNITQERINKIKRDLNIDNRMILLSFYDTVVGHIGTFSFEDQLKFMESINNLLDANSNFFIAFKSKEKPQIDSYPLEGKKILSMLDKLKENPRFVYANKISLNSYELMAVSDLVISAPLSSVLFEAVIGGVKSISYDPNSRYIGDYMLAEQFPNFSAHSHDELEKLIKYWLYDCDEKEFIKFQNKYIKRFFDDYCDGRAVNRLKTNLNI